MLIVLLPLAFLFYKKVNFVYFLVLFILLSFFVQLLGSYFSGFQLSVIWGLHTGPLTWRTLPQLVTSMFLHADLFHVVGNVIFLFFLGDALEERVGRWHFAVIFYLGGFCASFIFMLLHLGSHDIIIGASGAVSAVLGGLFVIDPRAKTPMFLGPVFLFRVPVYISALVFFGFETVYVILGNSDMVAHEAHLGGLFAGMVFGSLINLSTRADKKFGRRKTIKEHFKGTEAENILNQFEPSDPIEIRRVWVQSMVEKHSCSLCGGDLEMKDDFVRCKKCKTRFYF